MPIRDGTLYIGLNQIGCLSDKAALSRRSSFKRVSLQFPWLLFEHCRMTYELNKLRRMFASEKGDVTLARISVVDK